MNRKILLSFLLTVFIMSVASIAFADDMENRVSALEKHVDKHISHEEGPAFMNGIEIAAGITLSGQGTSGDDDNSNAEDSTDGIISADLEVAKTLGDNGLAFFSLDAGTGSGLDGDELTTYWGTNGDGEYGGDADDTFTLAEAWYEHVFFNILTFTIGKLDMTNYFDGNNVANDSSTQFLSDGFVNSFAIETHGNNPGMRLTISPHEIIDISLGAQAEGWDNLDERTFYIVEVAFKPKIGEIEGNYRLHLWTNQADYTEIADAASTEAHNTGFGISLDQQVVKFLTLFARADWADKKVAANEFVWSTGLALSGSLWTRNDDVIGIAYGVAQLSDDQRDTLSNPGDETHFEAYYSFAVNEHVAISPDVQIVTNANGDDDFETVWIGGIRGQFTY